MLANGKKAESQKMYSNFYINLYQAAYSGFKGRIILTWRNVENMM